MYFTCSRKAGEVLTHFGTPYGVAEFVEDIMGWRCPTLPGTVSVSSRLMNFIPGEPELSTGRATALLRVPSSRGERIHLGPRWTQREGDTWLPKPEFKSS